MNPPSPPRGMALVGYRPKPGLPKDKHGRLLLDFDFAPVGRPTKAEPEPSDRRQGLLV